MSVEVFFSLSSGLANKLRVPNGTKADIAAHVEEVETALGLKRTKYLDNPVHWDHFEENYRNGWPQVDENVLCNIIEKHNAWVRWLYRMFAEWDKSPVKGGETITPKDAAMFWHALIELEVRPERWSRDYYQARMEAIFAAMRGDKEISNEGIYFDAKALTPRQASAVILLFSPFLDSHDIRLEVPDGCDYLAASDDGGYDWCDLCGKAKRPEDVPFCRKRKCPLKAELA